MQLIECTTVGSAQTVLINPEYVVAVTENGQQKAILHLALPMTGGYMSYTLDERADSVAKRLTYRQE